MKRPGYAWAEQVEFKPCETGEILEGYIEVVDAFGTLLDSQEPSYDISVPAKNNAIYKHIPESYIRRKIPKEAVIKGILQYYPKNNMYSVLYSRNGYEAVIDDPFCTEIRPNMNGQWVPVYLTDLKKMVGESVEFRRPQPYVILRNLIHSHQNDSFMIYEIYREEANVVLYEGGVVMWKPEQLILRCGNHVAACAYGNERVFRWDVVDSVVRICLGKVEDPSLATLEAAKRSIAEIERVKNKGGNKDEFV